MWEHGAGKKGKIDKDVPEDVVDKLLEKFKLKKKPKECPDKEEEAPAKNDQVRSPYWAVPGSEDWDFSRTPYGIALDWLKGLMPAPPVPSSPDPYGRPSCPICHGRHF